MATTQRYPIGTRYMTHGKHPREAAVVDVHRTYNDAGELVKLVYVSEHMFCGQAVRDHNVPAATIARGLIDE